MGNLAGSGCIVAIVFCDSSGEALNNEANTGLLM